MGTVYSPNVVRDGCVLHLDAANPKSYPGTGTTWFDLSGNANDGTLINTPTYANGIMSFDGVGDYIEVLAVPGTGNSTSSLTWECYVKPATTAGDIINMTRGGWNMCPIWSSSQTFKGRVWGTSAITSDTFILGNYYHLVVVRDYATNTNSFYMNSELQGVSIGAYSASNGDNDHKIARQGNQATNTYFQGDIPIARVYNRALSAQEVAQNFEAMRGRYGI